MKPRSTVESKKVMPLQLQDGRRRVGDSEAFMIVAKVIPLSLHRGSKLALVFLSLSFPETVFASHQSLHYSKTWDRISLE